MTQYEKMGGTYARVGDYILPDVKIAAGQEGQIGVWGERHRRYLKEHHRVRYYNLLTSGMMNSHLAKIDTEAERMFGELVTALAEKENVTEALKATSPMEWVRRMSNIRNRATEIVNTEMIFT